MTTQGGQKKSGAADLMDMTVAELEGWLWKRGVTEVRLSSFGGEGLARIYVGADGVEARSGEGPFAALAVALRIAGVL